MASQTLIIMIIILVVFIGSMSMATGSVVNTTQFGNFTVEWEDFNLFTCAIPGFINVSLFTCVSSIGYVEMDDIDCLESTMINFTENTCSSTTMTTMYTSTNIITTEQITTVGMHTTGIITDSTTMINPTPVTSVTTTLTASQETSVTSMNNLNGTTITTSTSNSTTVSGTNGGNSTTSIGNLTSTSVTSEQANTTSTSSTTTTITTSTSSTTTTTTTSTGSTTTTATTSTTTTTTTSTTTTSTNVYTCSSDEYIGTYCNMSGDACAMSQPCQNAATCYPNNTLPYGYRCNCRAGYSGYDCEYDEGACTENTCWHNGTCIPVNSTVSSNNGSNFKCECVEGYDGRYCELEIDLCVNITCENRGLCSTVDLQWKCYCLDSSLYYGEYCQYKTNKLRIREILSTSFASIAIGAIVCTCSFVIIMDILKYAFHIDPVMGERESYRKRREELKRARQPVRHRGPKFALRFKYIS